MDIPDLTISVPTADYEDTDLHDMANLPREDTGLDGIVYVSTAEASHGPRVKWFPNRPQRDAPCLSVTIGPTPEARNLGLPPRIAEAASTSVKQWVTLNHAALLSFWNDGHSWTRQEVSAFLDRLVKFSAA